MRILKIVCTIIGTIIGAGFASGKEIHIFFFQYGKKGIIGVIFASLILGYTIYKTFKISYKNNINNYSKFLKHIFKNDKLMEITNIIINIFMLLSFYIMIAGFGAYLKQEYNINTLIGSSILAIICLVLFKFDIKGVVKANEILIPILIIFITIMRN